MRFLRIIFWGGLLLAGGIFFLVKKNGLNVEFNQDEESVHVRTSDPVAWDVLRDFSRLELRGAYKVIIHESSDSRVEIEASEKAKSELEASVDGSTLVVEMEDHWFKHLKEEIILHIYADRLESIDVAGATEMTNEGTLHGESLDIEVSGAGKINLNVELEDLDAEITGAGQYITRGTTESVQFEIAGAGDVAAFDLIASHVEVEISGAGSAKVHATESLSTQISGAGNVVYDGNPSNTSQQISGAGSVRKR